MNRSMWRRARLGPGLALGLGLVLAAGGCAAPRSQFPEVDASLGASEARKQREVVVRDLVDSQLRLTAVAGPLLIAAAPICAAPHRPVLGLSVINVDAFEGDYRAAAAALLGVGDRLVVVGVADGTPAAAAGFAAGDVLVSIDGKAVPAGKEAMADWARTLKAAAARAPGGFDIAVERGGGPTLLHVVPMTGCDYGVELVWAEDVNAFADGERVLVSRGMMRFATDDELALVIAHEIAHNAMGHMGARTQNAAGGAAGGLVLDILAAAAGINTGGAFMKMGIDAGAGAYSIEFEQEADYVGLYILARSGAPIARAPDFWRRMATLDPRLVEAAGTHPTSPARFVALEQAVAEIEAKRARGVALLPEMKPQESGAGTRPLGAGND